MTNSANRRAALAVLPAAALLAVPAAAPATPAAAGIDPRSGGLQVALGEWAIGIEAKAIRPGPVTLVVSNRGKLVHGLEIERVRSDGEDSDGDVDEETEDLRPGQTARLTVNLSPGVYELECSIGDHDDRGMRLTLVVRADAPLVKPAPRAGSDVAIRNFAYAPRTIDVKTGATVRWRNADAAPHTVTGSSFGSDVLNRNGTYSRRFTRAGTYRYICALHPAMKGTVVVR
jgi:plastocyanin